MPAIYTKMHLLAALKEAGLPHSYKGLMKLEAQGLIPRGGEIKSTNNDRFYTKEEIDSIVQTVKEKKK